MSGPNASITCSTPACFTFFPTRTAFATCAGSRPSSIPAGVCSCFVSATLPREQKDRDGSRSPSCAMPLPMAGKSNPLSPCASKSALSIDREPSPAKTRAAGSSSPAAWLKRLGLLYGGVLGGVALLIALLLLLKPSSVSWGAALVKAFLGNLLSGIVGRDCLGAWAHCGRSSLATFRVVAIRKLSRNGVRGDEGASDFRQNVTSPIGTSWAFRWDGDLSLTMCP